MEDRKYYIKISPEVVNTIYPVTYSYGEIFPNIIDDPCCDIVTTTTTSKYTGITYVYSSMTQVLSGGTGQTSLLTGLTIPILLTQETIDLGYYSVFDGAVLQKDTMLNFLFSSTTIDPYTYYFYNTYDSDKKYLQFSDFNLDWGDGTPIQTITTSSPDYYIHTYGSNGNFTITFSGVSPWGVNIIKKDIIVPFTDAVISNPYGTATFYPQGGNWSATPVNYDYIFTGDSYCDADSQISSNYTTVPFLVTGYTTSSVNDLQQYGPKTSLYAGKFKLGIQVTGTSGCIGTFFGPSSDNSYTSYTINDISYKDYSGGTTIFEVSSSGYTQDMLICSAITKDEVLLNVIDEPLIQSDVMVERGKISALESLQRLGEVDNVGDLTKYGYKFFNIINE
jgi:hypothetical protein